MATGLPGPSERKGRKAIIDDFLKPVREGLFASGGPRITVDRIVVRGPVAAVEARGLGRLRNGKEYNNRYAFFVEIKDEKVFALREYMDSYHVSTLT